MSRSVLSIVEWGGYPDFSMLYHQFGYQVHSARSMRKALSIYKKLQPDLLVAEFIYQSDFRDRVSNLESIFASVQRSGAKTEVILFCEREHEQHLYKIKDRFSFVREVLFFPIKEADLQAALFRFPIIEPIQNSEK